VTCDAIVHYICCRNSVTCQTSRRTPARSRAHLARWRRRGAKQKAAANTDAHRCNACGATLFPRRHSPRLRGAFSSRRPHPQNPQGNRSLMAASSGSDAAAPPPLPSFISDPHAGAFGPQPSAPLIHEIEGWTRQVACHVSRGAITASALHSKRTCDAAGVSRGTHFVCLADPPCSEGWAPPQQTLSASQCPPPPSPHLRLAPQAGLSF
jgi:hypothetical protein